MKVTIENKKGLDKDLKVFVDKKTIETHMNKKYEEIQKNIVLKGFRPGKVPKEVIKRQFGKSIYGEVLDNVLKDTTTKAIEENKLKPAGQPKIDLKSFGEGKDLEYIISITELPKVELKSLEKIQIDEYSVKIESNEIDKKITEIAKNQNNFELKKDNEKANEGDLISFDYKAQIDEKEFTGGEGKNTQIVLGKDLFIKGFDKQLIGVKKSDDKIVDVILPESYPQKEHANKRAIFKCKVLEIKKPVETKIDDEFAKNLGAKDLNDLKNMVSKQINDQYKNSLNSFSKNQILKQIENFKVEELPNNLIEQEVKILSEGMKDEELKKNKQNIETKAKKRIKVGLILNAFGEEHKINVTENEIQSEIQKQIKMMPGQEKMVMEYYQNNPSAANSLRGTIYEDKIFDLIKSKVKVNKKDITKEEAEKILKSANDEMHNNDQDQLKDKKDKKITTSKKASKASKAQKSKTLLSKNKKIKKVSKK